MDQDDEMEVEADQFVMRTYLREEEMDIETEQFQGWTSNQKSISAMTAEILGHLPLVNKWVPVKIIMTSGKKVKFLFKIILKTLCDKNLFLPFKLT